MGTDYGKLFLMLLAIGLIFLAASGRGRAVWSALVGSVSAAPASTVPGGIGPPWVPSGMPLPANPTNLDASGGAKA